MTNQESKWCGCCKAWITVFKTDKYCPKCSDLLRWRQGNLIADVEPDCDNHGDERFTKSHKASDYGL